MACMGVVYTPGSFNNSMARSFPDSEIAPNPQGK